MTYHTPHITNALNICPRKNTREHDLLQRLAEAIASGARKQASLLLGLVRERYPEAYAALQPRQQDSE